MRNNLRACFVSTVVLSLAMPVFTQQRATANNLDWPTFGGDVARTSASTAATRITAANVASLQRQQVMIDGIVDASLIYLRGVQVSGANRDVFFATTSYGKTFAMDANDGKILWTFVSAGFDQTATPREITNS